MATKPDVNSLIGWLKLQSPPTPDTLAVYETCIEVAIEDIESRINLPAGTTDENYPTKIAAAIIMNAARLAKRSTSPEGVAGMSDIGAVVRILSRDPDVERLVSRYLKLDGFS